MIVIRLMPLLLFPVQPGLDCPAQLVNTARQPAARCIPGHLTNYWPFLESGELMDGWGGQCDSDCSKTATGVPTEQGVGWIAACPDHMIGETVSLREYGTWACNDAFGAPAYRDGPFFHEGRGIWVMPFDLLWPEPTYELIWNWSLEN